MKYIKALVRWLKKAEKSVAMVWPGVKTKLVLVLGAVAPVAALFGYTFDVDTIINHIEAFGGVLLAGQAFLLALAYWFRRLTDLYNEIMGIRRPTEDEHAQF